MKTENENLKVHVLFRFSKKTGKIDTTMTGLGTAMMQMWALNNTTKTKSCMIFERENGKVKYATYGTADGFPKVKDCRKDGDLGNCEQYGIPLVSLQEITDDRFD